MNKVFPNLHKALGGEKTCPVYKYAIVEDGKIVLTNGHLIVVSDFSVFADNSEFAENKVFSQNLLKWMSKSDFKRLECTEDGIIAFISGDLTEEKPYSGTWAIDKNERRVLDLYEKTDGNIGSFPEWKNVIPEDSSYKESAGKNEVGFSTGLLSIVNDCFVFGNEVSALKFEFADKEKSVARITPVVERRDRDGKQCMYLSQYEL